MDISKDATDREGGHRTPLLRKKLQRAAIRYSRVQIDAGGRVTKLLSKSKAKKGKTMRLTLDWSLQKTAEAALQAGS